MSNELELLLRRSVARCETRWLAAGVEPALAKDLAEDDHLGEPAPEMLPSAERPLIVLQAEVGAGKSLVSERALQQAARRFENEPRAPIPCWLRVKDLQTDIETAVVSQTKDLGDIHEHGCFVVLDGADEPGVGKADEALQQARTLVRTLSHTEVLLSSRPLPPFNDAPEIVLVPRLSEGEAMAIVARISGQDITPGRASTWAKSLQDAIRRPLFAVLLGVFLRQNGGQPPAPAELLRNVVEGALGRARGADRTALRRIAARVIDAGGTSISRGEVGDKATEEALAETRLITISEHHLSFPLILIAQWFAAEGIAVGETPIESLTARPETLELWRYPLAIAVGAFGEEQVNRVLAPLVENHAGFASQIVEEALARWSLEGDAFGDGEQAAQRVRAAMSSWTIGAGELAELCAPINAEGQLLPIGFNVDGDWFDTGWYLGQDTQPAVRPLPGGTMGFMSQHGISPEDRLAWIRVRGARPGHQAAWHWRWAFEDMRNALQTKIKTRKLEFLDSPLRQHRLWIVAKSVLGLGWIHREPIEVQDVLNRLDAQVDAVLVAFPKAEIRVNPNRPAFEQLLADGVTVLSPTLEPPRAEFSGGWVWDGWDRDGHLKRTQQAYELAVAGYEHLTQGQFAALSPWMQTASTLPAVVHVEIDFSDTPGFEGAPTETMWLEPLPFGESSRVETRFGSGVRWNREEWQRRQSDLRRLRPNQARWIGMVLHHGVLDLDNDSDVEELIYKWLWGDLGRIKWVDGLLGTRTPGSGLVL